VEYLDHLAQLRTADPELAGTLEGVDCLEKVLAWLQRSGIGTAGLDVVAQDEYSHDLFIPLGTQGRWLVSGMT
jgi:hypothetical protein